MTWLRCLFRSSRDLDPVLWHRLQAWRALPAVDERTRLGDLRLVVADCETSGLNPQRDQLLALGAVAVQGRRLVAGDGFARVLRRSLPRDDANILVHGIGPQAQAAGDAPEAALMDFLEYAGKHALVAFHARFDQAVIDRATREILGVRPPNRWVDLARLAPALVPEARMPHASLDDWLGYCGLRALARHRATDDAFASAELLLILLARARARGIETLGQMLALCEQQARLLPGSGVGGA